ncbi:SDR family oxidoreductase [Lentibacter algarum]|uniref:SDR family NAD(P)-dependent oxidoreductase n=1 Tax=Lentibacter algarum TaxID=576131 RepID=UPI001C06A9AC|nr:SDR family oxidoreductase [Lentibacter algarum]MBU2980498.1 SDR family oxidoreductase [Lentibacter algarum]
MDVSGKTVVVTGAARGIGLALVNELRARGAAHVAATDILESVHDTPADSRHVCDVTDAAQVEALAVEVEDKHGPISLFCSNAGVLNGLDLSFENAGGASAEDWALSWNVNVMAHVNAANAMVPRYKAQGGGYFLNTASAAGLLTLIGSAPYSVTKHAALGFAENLAITHRDDGIRVSALCPQAVNTAMIGDDPNNPAAMDGIISAEDVAKAAIDGVEAERFLILPHPNVDEYFRAKAANYERWIGGMAKMQRQFKV